MRVLNKGWTLKALLQAIKIIMKIYFWCVANFGLCNLTWTVEGRNKNKIRRATCLSYPYFNSVCSLAERVRLSYLTVVKILTVVHMQSVRENDFREWKLGIIIASWANHIRRCCGRLACVELGSHHRDPWSFPAWGMRQSIWYEKMILFLLIVL